MIFSNGWSIIVGASALSLPSSRIANNRCPAKSAILPRVEPRYLLCTYQKNRTVGLQYNGRSGVPFPPVGTMSPSFHTVLFSHALFLRWYFFDSESMLENSEGFVLSENCHLPPILSRRLSGGGRPTNPTA